MNVRHGEETMDSWMDSVSNRIEGALHIAWSAPRQSSDDGATHLTRHRLHSLKVAMRSNGEAGLNHVHAEPFQLARHGELFMNRHAATRRLLAIAECGVEDDDVLFWHRACGSKRYDPIHIQDENGKVKQ